MAIEKFPLALWQCYRFSHRGRCNLEMHSITQTQSNECVSNRLSRDFVLICTWLILVCDMIPNRGYDCMTSNTVCVCMYTCVGSCMHARCWDGRKYTSYLKPWLPKRLWERQSFRTVCECVTPPLCKHAIPLTPVNKAESGMCVFGSVQAPAS